MPRYFAFLRAINVGGHHQVKMAHLKKLFESLGFDNVETFIASGNVIFSTPSKNVRALEKKIETKLLEELGYEVATFVRTETELREIANCQPFAESDLESAVALNIAFFGDALDEDSAKKTTALSTDIDELHVQGREIYWLCRKRQSESTISNAMFNKTIRRPSTVRGLKTIKKMADKYCGSK
jgi:uncharacterized protein (DUF1697 family)